VSNCVTRKLAEKVAVITGATFGMALATAKLFVAEGVRSWLIQASMIARIELYDK
jgi:NADP-dependent 3-hydroxy acid dehydrogenase YdfG